MSSTTVTPLFAYLVNDIELTPSLESSINYAACATPGVAPAQAISALEAIRAAAPSGDLLLNAGAKERADALADYGKLIDKHTDSLETGVLLDLLSIFLRLGVPEALAAPFARAAFRRLNALPDAERRAAIDMHEDVYDESTAVLREIAVARTAELVPDATGTFYRPPANDNDDAAFAWPAADQPPLAQNVGDEMQNA